MKPARACLTVALILAGVALAFAPLSQPPARADAPGDSAVTVSGTGAFADLRVSVSQTKELINQAITISWTGGAVTQPNTGQFAVNFLQIMQCWGDDPTGPDRSQCQYGGTVNQSTPPAGAWVRSRQVNYPGLDDPLEPYKQGDDPSTPEDESRENVFVPFWAVGTDRPTKQVYTGRSDFIDGQLTNEIPLARTRGNGKGVEFFEVQTARQAAGLGCGAPVGGGNTTGRSCWLVIVPRGLSEVNGSNQAEDELVSSPLSQTNWNNRIAVKLEFQPVQTACPIGAAERRLSGHEQVVEAVSRWQPALCAGGGTLFGFTQLSDDVARNRLLQAADPGLAMMANPVPPDAQLPARPLVYAPIALSGLTIAFFVERQVPPNGGEEDKLTDGERYGELKLTPRLVAKLLTQSYRGSVVGSIEHLRNNRAGLADDEEFLQLNPAYRGFQTWTTVADALVPLGTSDATALLWSWVIADQQAREFIAGTPDAAGMVVNINNKGVVLPSVSFPRNDQTCFGDNTPFRFCTLDAHPFSNDMHEAGRAASRGDTLGRHASGTPNPDGTPKLTKIDRQAPGRRGVLAVVDTATAERYGLPQAKLRNASGEFVAPTTGGLLAAAGAMRPTAVPGVLAPNPTATGRDTYPLATLTYAAASPPLLTPVAGRDYATFLRYAVGAGQRPGFGPGQLPLGYAPLPDPLRAQTISAAATIESQAGTPVGGTPTGQPNGGPGSGAGPDAAAANPGQGAGTPAEAPVSTPPAATTPPKQTAAQPVAEVRRTPALRVGVIRYVLAVLLVGGGLAAAAAPVLHRFGQRPGGPGGGALPAGGLGAWPPEDTRTTRSALSADAVPESGGELPPGP